MEKREVKVQVNHLTKRFGDLLVLDDISFEINKGEFVCIVGPTGCGKTTFLNLLTGLLEPTEGEILIDGERADPEEAQHFICISGALGFSVADGSAEHRIRPENQEETGTGNCFTARENYRPVRSGKI